MAPRSVSRPAARRVSAREPQAKLSKTAKLRHALKALERMYGPRAWVRRRGSGGAVDVLVEAMLAQNTNMVNAARGFKQLRRQFPSWSKVMAAPVADVQRQIAVCGLARMRARRLQDMLRQIRADRGRMSIEFLAELEPAEGEKYLTGFFGIGPKTAAFTLLFAFNLPVLPVDNGILRVLRRTGLVRPRARDAEAQRTVAPLVPPGRHYAAHTLLFRHAKATCRPRNPKCGECGLLSLCPTGRRRVRHAPPGREQRAERRFPVVPAKFASAGVPKRSATTDAAPQRRTG